MEGGVEQRVGVIVIVLLILTRPQCLGRLRHVQVFDAPRGTGPYGIATAPDGMVYYASLAGSYIARVVMFLTRNCG